MRRQVAPLANGMLLRLRLLLLLQLLLLPLLPLQLLLPPLSAAAAAAAAAAAPAAPAAAAAISAAATVRSLAPLVPSFLSALAGRRPGHLTTAGQGLAPFGLRWYEEAGDPLDYLLQSELSKVISSHRCSHEQRLASTVSTLLQKQM